MESDAMSEVDSVNPSCLEWVLVEWEDWSNSLDIVHADFVNHPKQELHTGKKITVRDKTLRRPAKIIMCGDDYGFLTTQLRILQEDIYSSDDADNGMSDSERGVMIANTMYDQSVSETSRPSTIQDRYELSPTAPAFAQVAAVQNENVVLPTWFRQTRVEVPPFEDLPNPEYAMWQFRRLMHLVSQKRHHEANAMDSGTMSPVYGKTKRGAEENGVPRKAQKLRESQMSYQNGDLSEGGEATQYQSEEGVITDDLLNKLIERIIAKYTTYIKRLNSLAQAVELLEDADNPRVRAVTPDEMEIDPALEDIVTYFTKTEDVNGVRTKEELVAFGPGRTTIPKYIFENINWTTYTTATRYLLMKIFPRKTLATHSLTGKSSPAFAHIPSKRQLDPIIVRDIVQLVSKKTKTPENIVRSVITTKCADENKMYRQRVAKIEKKKKLALEIKMQDKNKGKENLAPVSQTSPSQRPALAPLEDTESGNIA